MPRIPATQSARLRLAAAIVLVAGWVAAACIFLMASHGDETGSATYRVVYGQVYTTPFEASKRELQQVERMGGKAAVRTMELSSWIGTLWRGKQLACMLALLSSVVGATLIYLAGLAAEAPQA